MIIQAIVYGQIDYVCDKLIYNYNPKIFATKGLFLK